MNDKERAERSEEWDEAGDCDPSGQGCKSCQRYLDDCDGKEDE